MSVPAYYVIRHDVPDGRWPEFFAWMSREEMPHVLSHPGFRGAVTYREAGLGAGRTTSYTLYETDGRETAEAYRRKVDARRIEGAPGAWRADVDVEDSVLERVHEVRPRRRSRRRKTPGNQPPS